MLTGFHMLKQLWIPGINSSWSSCIILLICCEIDLLLFCWEFWINIHKGYWSVVFLKYLCLALEIRTMLASEWVRKCSLLFSFLEKSEKGWFHFFKCLEEFTKEAIRSTVFLFWKIFDYWFNLLTSYILLTDLFKFSICDLVLITFLFLEICISYLGHQIFSI